MRTGSGSESFSSGEEDGPPPDLREVKKKSRSKEDSLREKPPLPSKHAAPPIVSAPVDSALVTQESNVDEDGFVAVKAENLFDISEGEEDDEDKNNDSGSEDEKLDSKQGKKRRDEEEENSSESEEEEEEEKDVEDEKRGTATRRGSDHFKTVSTALSSFLNPGEKASKKKPARQESEPEAKDNEEGEGMGKEKTEETNEKEDEEDDDEEEEEKEEEEEEEEEEEDKEEEDDAKPAKEEEEEEEEEPRVEFTGETKPEVKFNQLIFIGRQSIAQTKEFPHRLC